MDVSPVNYSCSDNKLTDSRQLIDKVFWRQFTDRIEDSSSILSKTVHRQNFILYLHSRR